MLKTNPVCEGLNFDSKDNLVQCKITSGLCLNNELRYFCKRHFYEPDVKLKKNKEYNPDEYGGYVLASSSD